MDDALVLIAARLGLSGWFCALLTRFLSVWTVSGTVDNTTDSLAMHWDGVWIHWEQKGDDSLHCHFIQAMLQLSGNFQSWRDLITASICISLAANGLYLVGQTRLPVKVVSGVLFVLSGVLLLVVTSWVSHDGSEAPNAVTSFKREWGPALYTGWVGTALLLVVGGGTLVSTCCFSPPTEVNPYGFD
ncbi:claudin-4-like [Clupea harengus]|uniref:Claudin-4-like n=1 Tax=Clupea harengus TaxID=7950 RepID=A0A6P3W3E3_CLUHA|nr:claudin-4-like [Clupea harengus]XP_042564711.1 claudin-4-like [Clupea harengus]